MSKAEGARARGEARATGLGKTFAQIQKIDPVASHASWMENFPWTRLGNVAMPATKKPMLEMSKFLQVDPKRKKELLGDIYMVTAQAQMPDGRVDESTGALSVAGLKGEALATAYMKCEAKAKRRVTL